MNTTPLGEHPVHPCALSLSLSLSLSYYYYYYFLLTICCRSYVPMEGHSKAASLTLAYAFDDWAVGQMAALLGNSTDAQYFLNRSKSYRHVWEAKSEYMCPRLNDGVWNKKR